MIAVHFGAGNIGRGFIGALLYQAGYQTIFIDVNEAVIDALNEEGQYDVILSTEHKESVTIQHVSGINNGVNPDAVIDAITNADIVTTAIGPTILPRIAELIAQSLRKRAKENPRHLNIIACENMIGGSTFLQEHVYTYIPDDEKEICNELYGFPNAAVDRIVPNQSNENLLEVAVEPYYEWVVDETGMKGNIPEISGITYVKELQPYIERKLLTVNTGHAVPAFMGHYLGYETIETAMHDQEIQEMIQGVLDETGEALIQTYHFSRDQHEAYKEKIIERFKNPYISDHVTRVARNPMLKLGPKDRLVYPAALYMEKTGETPGFLAKLIAAVLLYQNNEDAEAVQLQQKVQENGYETVLSEVAHLSPENPITALIMNKIHDMK